MYVVLLITLMAGPSSANTLDVEKTQMCAVGRAALNDLPVIKAITRTNHLRTETFYSGKTDEYHRDLLEQCPNLRSKLPTGFPLATDAAFKRLHDINTAAPVSMFDVEVPVLKTGATRATVSMGYSCSGLCGARFTATYARTAKGWKRTGQPIVTSVF